jgi:hypothetical protein
MPKLKNQRRELFAQNIFKGMTLAQSYRRAGFKGDANGLSSNMAKIPEIRARVAELNSRIERKAILTKSQAIEMLSQGAQAAFRFIQKAGVFGIRSIKMNPAAVEEDPDLKLAVREITMDKDGTARVKLHDYREALALLAKLEGWEAPKSLDIRSHRSLKDMTDEELASLAGEGTAPHGTGE